MSDIDESVQALTARLPELSWKLRSGFKVINPSLLPRGLFRSRLEFTPETCIDDITRDIASLEKEKSERIGHFLATRISHKINVLVRLCQMPKVPHAPQKSALLTLECVSTRSQWLKTLQDDIVSLKIQQQALQERLIRAEQEAKEHEVVLKITSELGDIRRCLTLAEESLAHSMR